MVLGVCCGGVRGWWDAHCIWLAGGMKGGLVCAMEGRQAGGDTGAMAGVLVSQRSKGRLLTVEAVGALRGCDGAGKGNSKEAQLRRAPAGANPWLLPLPRPTRRSDWSQ